eukprot:7652325-Alexandrium_andersonii.AAC.1
MQDEVPIMCTWTDTTDQGIEARVVQLPGGQYVAAVGLDQAPVEPTFAMPVVREGSIARLPGAATRAE